MIVGIPKFAQMIEVGLVNGLGLPFNSGIIITIALLIGGLIYGIIYSIKNQKRHLNTILNSVALILLGYSSIAIMVIRSNQNTPIDMNNPENMNNLISFVEREQYGKNPLLKGHQFNMPQEQTEEGRAKYIRTGDEYKVYGYSRETKTDPRYESFFPRMYHNPDKEWKYKALLKEWYGPNAYRQGQKIPFSKNLTYLVKRQLGHYYWRYLMWNFVGREGHVQDAGVMSPLESSDDKPEILQSDYANNFYALPFLLGLLGIVYNFMKGKRSLAFLAMLFFFSGIAIILYLNPPPYEPRERDYAYVGSYYVFCIWIAFGVLMLIEMITQSVKNHKLVALATSAICLIVPGIMLSEGWKEHDRSERYYSVDSAKNLLNSCAPNAILFTAGDNDTYPLWFAQEVEEFRTDVRVVNLSLLNTDWYIEQMSRELHKSPPLPTSLRNELYIEDRNNYCLAPETAQGKEVDLNKFLLAVNQERLKIPGKDEVFRTRLPGTKFTMFVNQEAVKKQDFMPKELKNRIIPRITFNTGRVIYKKDLYILDLINEMNKQGWERPLYFDGTAAYSIEMGIKDYLVSEGLVQRFVPAKVGQGMNSVNLEKSHENLMNNCFWRNLDKPGIFYSDQYTSMVYNSRAAFLTTTQIALLKKDTAKAVDLIGECLSVIPDESFPFYDSRIAPRFVSFMYSAKMDQATELAQKLFQRGDEVASYYADMNGQNTEKYKEAVEIMQQMLGMADQFDDEVLIQKGLDKMERFSPGFKEEFNKSRNMRKGIRQQLPDDNVDVEDIPFDEMIEDTATP
jgi:hypothetical protein